MRTRYRVIFSEAGFIRHSCVQEASDEREAIELARMYSGLKTCPARIERAESEENQD